MQGCQGSLSLWLCGLCGLGAEKAAMQEESSGADRPTSPMLKGSSAHRVVGPLVLESWCSERGQLGTHHFMQGCQGSWSLWLCGLCGVGAEKAAMQEESSGADSPTSPMLKGEFGPPRGRSPFSDMLVQRARPAGKPPVYAVFSRVFVSVAL